MINLKTAMRRHEYLSESAKWFLEELQKTLDHFADAKGIQVVVIDREGNLVSKFYGVQRACKLIVATEEGRIRCIDHFRMALYLMKNEKKPLYMQCYAGFASLWAPVVINGRAIGAVIACGGKYADGENKNQFNKKFSELASQLGIIDKKDFQKAAIEETVFATKKDMEERIEKIKELFEILSKTAHTPLKEVFG